MQDTLEWRSGLGLSASPDAETKTRMPFSVSRARALFAVSDGMGGYEGGATASRLALEHFGTRTQLASLRCSGE